MRTRIALAAMLSTALASHAAEPATPRRALLIGINDYSASRLASTGAVPVPGRFWPNLDGAVNDVSIMRDLLIARKGFAPSEIVTLTDEQATRAAILNAIDTQLVAPAKKGGIVLFYYSGHGSQVCNTLSDEVDRLDESLVPADSRRGAPDIRDKELRRRFNSILDRGALLTVVLDSCHSASGARGFDGGARFRSVKADDRDVADRSVGPLPEHRGALIFSAAQDFDLAYETMDNGSIHGAFSWALARAIRDAPADEPASATFARAEARLRVEMPAQEPVIAGNTEARGRPFVAERQRGATRSLRPVIAVEKALLPGQYSLNGGWVNGLTTGSELRLSGNDGVRLEVTSLNGMSHAVARLLGDRAAPLANGSLLEIATWAVPPGRPLRVCIPQGADEAVRLARALRAEMKRKGIRWIDDPTEATPMHFLRLRGEAWELATGAIAAAPGTAPLAHVPAGESVFVQLPVAAPLASALLDVKGVEAAGPETADYVLVGRLAERGVEYAWVRPSSAASDGKRTVLPVRTAWVPASLRTAALTLRETMERLERVHAWHELTSPLGAEASYILAVRRDSDGTLVNDATLVGGDHYRLVMRERNDAAAAAAVPRYVYVFVIDSSGSGVLLFPLPAEGSVENRLPLVAPAGEPLRSPPREIPLDEGKPFVVTEPFGVDTYFLLCTGEPLGCPSCLEWDGVRGLQRQPKSELERLLAATASGRRGGGDIRTPPNWSLEKAVYESVPPGGSPR